MNLQLNVVADLNINNKGNTYLIPQPLVICSLKAVNGITIPIVSNTRVNISTTTVELSDDNAILLKLNSDYFSRIFDDLGLSNADEHIVLKIPEAAQISVLEFMLNNSDNVYVNNFRIQCKEL